MPVSPSSLTTASNVAQNLKPLSKRLEEGIREIGIKIIRFIGDCFVEVQFLGAHFIKKYTSPIKERLAFIKIQKEEAIMTAYYLKVIGIVLSSMGLFFGSASIACINSVWIFPIGATATVTIGLFARDFFKISDNLIKYAESPWITFDGMNRKSFWEGKTIFTDVFVVNKEIAQGFKNNFVLLLEIFKATS